MIINVILLSVFVIPIASGGLWAQFAQGTAIEKVGYQFPAPVNVAPGQLVTVFVHGIETYPMKRAPAGSDLPTSLEGISSDLIQISTSSQLLRWQLPILETRWFLVCLTITPVFCNTPTAAVTLQIPFDLQVNLDSCPTCTAGTADLSVSRDGGNSVPFDVTIVPDRVRIVRVFDSVLPIGPRESVAWCSPLDRLMNTAPYNMTDLPCPAIVKHADGSLVMATNPARAGEELVAYAVGLGRTSPASETGKVVTSSAPTVTTFALDFNYRRNALATRPPPLDGDVNVPVPIYSGTLEGEVGLYQVKFRVPPVPPGTPPCAALDRRFLPQENVVYSNLTVSVGGLNSFDGAGICVAVDDAITEQKIGEKK